MDSEVLDDEAMLMVLSMNGLSVERSSRGNPVLRGSTNTIVCVKRSAEESDVQCAFDEFLNLRKHGFF